MRMHFVKSLEVAWRHGVAYPLLRLILHNPPQERQIDLASLRSILILRYDRIGDMIVTTPIIRAIRRAAPHLRIGVFASELNAEIIRNNPNVDRIHLLRKNWLALCREIDAARSERYDLVLNFIFNRTSSAGLLANLISPRGIKVGQGDEKYRFYFNRLLKLDRRAERMVETLSGMLDDLFGLKVPDDQLRFEIFIDSDSRKSVDQFLVQHQLAGRDEEGKGLRFAVFNVSATDPVRRLSWSQVDRILRHASTWTNLRMVVVSAPADARRTRERIQQGGCSPHCIQFPQNGFASLLQVASLIERAVCVLTPDTAIVHIAAAMRTPVLGLYTPLQDVHEWLPLGIPFKAVLADAGQPTSTIPVANITKQLDEFIGVYLKR